MIIPIQRLVGNSARGTLGQWASAPCATSRTASENPEFLLNRAPYRGAPDPAHRRQLRLRLLARGRGVGAAWDGHALRDRPSFGDIFFNNCFQNGLLPVVLDRRDASRASPREVEASQGAGRITVDLDAAGGHGALGQARCPSPSSRKRRQALLEGLDEIAHDPAARRRDRRLSGARPGGARLGLGQRRPPLNLSRSPGPASPRSARRSAAPRPG